MKATLSRDSLLHAIGLVSSAAAGGKVSRPILAHIKAMAHDDALVLMGTDMEVGIRYELRGVKVGRAGAAILPPAKLTSILRETTDAEITLDADAETTRIKLSTGRYELPGGAPDEFPDIPTFDAGDRYHEVTAGSLRSLIKRTVFAAEKKESTRWAVTGVLFEPGPGGVLTVVATDTKRMAKATAAVTYGPDGEAAKPALVPVKAVGILEKNLADDGEIVRVLLRPNEALFQTERAVIHTKLVEGRFPPYRDIIPKKMAHKLTVDAAALLARVRQAAITTDEDSKRVDFHFEPGRVVLTARGPETGSSEVEMALPEYDGPVVDIAFDPAYLTDMLRAIDGEPTLTLEMTDGQKPAVFRAGETYLYLVMPLAG